MSRGHEYQTNNRSIYDYTDMNNRYEYNFTNENNGRRLRSINLPIQNMSAKGNICVSNGTSCSYYISNICGNDEVSSW
jgi:hypothetical protein